MSSTEANVVGCVGTTILLVDGVRSIGLDLTSDVFIRSRECFLDAAARLEIR